MAVAKVEPFAHPVSFKLRSIDSDIRSQIYEIAIKKETDFDRGDGSPKERADEHPSYATSSVSVDSIAHEDATSQPQKSRNSPGVSAYLSTVKDGDMETAQRMVDEAAKRAGYTQRAYHGTDADRFNVFDPVKIGDATGVGILGDGFYFADSKKAANKYGKTVYDVYLKAENTYHASEADLYKIKAVELEKQGYDSVDLQTGIGKIIMVFDPQQIKSADPVTYDDGGNAIPLSERFNEKKSDIRFSKKSGNEKLNIDHAEKSSYNGSKNKNGGDQNDGNRVAGEVDRGRSEGREVRTAAETGRNVGRGYQVPDRVDLSQSLNKAFEESGVVATELYDYSGDSAAYSSALDAARNADDRTGDGSVSFRELPLSFVALLVKTENRPLSC